MTVLEDRYQLCPYMRIYDRLEPVLLPYMTFGVSPNFRSEVVNTDRHGFRLSFCHQQPIDSLSWWQASRRGLLLGGSFVFGVGSTTDRSTVVSQLGTHTGIAFLNLGIRAGNSLQELIAALPFLSSADIVMVCSGMNTLITHLQSLGMNELYGPLFGEECFAVLSRQPLRELANWIEHGGQPIRLGRLVRTVGESVRRRLASQNGTSPHPASLQASSSRDFATAMARAVQQQERDLRVIARVLPEKARLLFAVQPVAAGLRKTFLEEEVELFRLNDCINAKIRRDQWMALKQHMVEYWPKYTELLQQMCQRLGVPFLDLNGLTYHGWCFVDQVHMTDEGQAQTAAHLASRLS